MREKRGKVEKKGREKQRGREKGESECVHERNINVMRDREKRNRKGERIREREMERAEGLLGRKFLFKSKNDGTTDKTKVVCSICQAEFSYHRKIGRAHV